MENIIEFFLSIKECIALLAGYLIGDKLHVFVKSFIDILLHFKN